MRSLTGWSLTDDPEREESWMFPDVDLDGGAYLVVFASGKDRRFPDQELHLNFQLGRRVLFFIWDMHRRYR